MRGFDPPTSLPGTTVVTHVLGTTCYLCLRVGQAKGGGAGGIRTLDRALQPYNGLANRRLQPLGHSSMSADMPDARASRKRQIQITPRPYIESPALRAHSSRTADIPYRAFRHIFPGSAVSMTLSNPHGIRAARPDPGRSFRHVFAQASRRNRGKLIRWHRRADSIPRESRFQVGTRNAGFSPHSIMPSDPAKYRASILFRRFFALVGGPLRVRRPSQPAPVTNEHDPLTL